MRATRARAKARVALAHAAAHELRQPLHAIVALVGSLRSSENPFAAGMRLGDRLEQSAQALNRTLLDVVDAFDLWAGQCPMEVQSVDLSSELALMVRRKNHELAEQGSSVKVLCGHVPDLSCQLDLARFCQVIGALTDEAAYHTTNGRVRVTCELGPEEDSHQWLSVFVHASGLVVSEAEADSLFAPDQYQDNRLLKGRPAAMMALNVARQVTLLMGGDIKVESQPHAGTRFIATLPTTICPPSSVASFDTVLPRARLKSGQGPDLSQLTVLLVDDEEANLFALQELVLPLGFGRVVCAASGEEAIARCRREPIDLVLMDLVMPGTDGFDAAATIRLCLGDRAPMFMAVSANPDAERNPRYQAAGFRCLIRKPIEKDAFPAALVRFAPNLLEQPYHRKPSKGPAALRLASG